MDKDFLNKMYERQEKMSEDINEIKVILGKQEEHLKQHILRTELAEENIALLREQIQPIEKHVQMVSGVLKFLGLISVLVGIVLGIKGIFA